MSRTVGLLSLTAATGLLLLKHAQAAPGMDIVASWDGNSTRPASSNLLASSLPWDWLPFLPEAIFRWAPSLALMDIRVRTGLDRSDSDPLWKEAADLIRSAAYASPPGKRFMDLCSADKLAEYSAGACAADTLGSIHVRGFPADAYFCGSTKSGINWARPWLASNSLPVAHMCDAEPGTAYKATGTCGRWSTKQLVVSFFYTVPLWGIDPVMLNAPSLHCLLGLGNCDIYYCQHCPGRCGPA